MTSRDFSGFKLFDGGRAPNPRRVRMFLAEKGIEVPLVPVDMEALGHKGEDVTARNPMQRLPVLDPLRLCRPRVVDIALYVVEALCPEPRLFGDDPFEQAEIEMWQRRIEWHYLLPIAQAFRHIHPAMKEWEIPQVAEWGEANKPKALEFAKYLDCELATRAFIAGDRFSIVDITAVIATDFCKPARIRIPDEMQNLHRWYAQIRERPSYRA